MSILLHRATATATFAGLRLSCVCQSLSRAECFSVASGVGRPVLRLMSYVPEFFLTPQLMEG